MRFKKFIPYIEGAIFYGLLLVFIFIAYLILSQGKELNELKNKFETDIDILEQINFADSDISRINITYRMTISQYEKLVQLIKTEEDTCLDLIFSTGKLDTKDLQVISFTVDKNETSKFLNLLKTVSKENGSIITDTDTIDTEVDVVTKRIIELTNKRNVILDIVDTYGVTEKLLVDIDSLDNQIQELSERLFNITKDNTILVMITVLKVYS